MVTDDRNIPGEAEGGRAWHNAVPAWIRSDPAYQRLRQGPRHTLQMIANRCDNPPRDKPCEIMGSAALLICIGGDRLIADCGCHPATFWRHKAKLSRCGFIVRLSGGIGRLADVYGIPGHRGELDPYRAKRGERRGTGPGGRWTHPDTRQLRSLVSHNATLAGGVPSKGEHSQNATAALAKCGGSYRKMRRQPSQNATLPSPLPSSSTSAHKPSPLGSRKARALLHDDDRDTPPDPNTGPLADQLSIRLPDGAGPDQVNVVLRKYGVDAGRAHKLAFDPLTTPAMVRDVIARADGYRKANPGAYLGNMLADAIAKARDAEREHEAQAFEARQQRLADAEALIDTMSDAELGEAIESNGAFKDLSPPALRADHVLRAELSRHLTNREAGVA